MTTEILLPHDTEFVPVADIPALIAKALHPDVLGQPRTVSYFIKFARPGATGETAKWNGWPIDDDDRNALAGICGNAPPVGATDDEVQPYLEKANAAGLDWELAVCWKNHELNADLNRHMTMEAHEKAIRKAIGNNQLQALNPTTRLPANEYQSHAVVSLDNLTNYLGQFQIGVKLKAVPSARPNNKKPLAQTWWRTDYEIMQIAQSAGDSLRRKGERTSNRAIGDAVALEIERREKSGGKRKGPDGQTIKNTDLKGWKYEAE